ncbi:4'-phosphopantetheinyl transferase family protein [Chitinimonas sp. JJ19]|uniref:4'-phosphopantetheinyl transferase family protein n=1 Tax=Chitinimonas sp. JJ19 TaxID=3109352 RepID=UPI001A3CBD1D|nr:4'-phosphopantetheinyl transferase superfamily protein [Chitinimonas sp.]
MRLQTAQAAPGVLLRAEPAAGCVRRLRVRMADGRWLSASLVQFEPQQFDGMAFATHGIDCPPSIAASVRKRQAEFFFGRLAAAHALAAQGVDPAPIPIGPSREPLWPLGVVGSISHNDEYAAAMVLDGRRYGGVGIDIERTVSADMQPALLATAVSAAELRYLETLTSELPLATLLTIVFSAKESLFKGAFRQVGRFFDFDAAHLSCLDVQQGRLTLVLQETLSVYLGAGRACEISFDFIQPDTVFTSFACPIAAFVPDKVHMSPSCSRRLVSG